MLAVAEPELFRIVDDEHILTVDVVGLRFLHRTFERIGVMNERDAMTEAFTRLGYEEGIGRLPKTRLRAFDFSNPSVRSSRREMDRI